MTIERLPFNDPNFFYHPMEASIHVTRYQLAQPYIQGKRVLDISCGEGYGSWLLKSWGAASVVGVDVSPTAIKHAEHFFSHEDIEFVCDDAIHLNWIEKFDVIVSLETIEHVSDPVQFLKTLQSSLSLNGIIIISCPNDEGAAWSENECNPYHLKRYTMQEFMDETESVLGAASSWLVGSNVFGYGNFHYDKHAKTIDWHKSPLLTTDVIQQSSADFTLCHNDLSSLPSAESSLYYVGIWGKQTIPASSGTIFPIKPLNLDINTLKKGYFDTRQALDNAQKQLSNVQDDHLKQKGTIHQLERELFYAQQRALLGQALSSEQSIVQDYLSEHLHDISSQEKDYLINELKQRSLLVDYYQANLQRIHEGHQLILKNEQDKISLLQKQIDEATININLNKIMLNQSNHALETLSLEHQKIQESLQNSLLNYDHLQNLYKKTLDELQHQEMQFLSFNILSKQLLKLFFKRIIPKSFYRIAEKNK